MKFSLDTLKKLVTGLRYGERTHPARDWFLLVGLLAVALVAIVAWSVLFFLSAVEREVAAARPEAAAVDAQALEEVRALFERRANETERFRSEYQFIDPSR